MVSRVIVGGNVPRDFHCFLSCSKPVRLSEWKTVRIGPIILRGKKIVKFEIEEMISKEIQSVLCFFLNVLLAPGYTIVCQSTQIPQDFYIPKFNRCSFSYMNDGIVWDLGNPYSLSKWWMTKPGFSCKPVISSHVFISFYLGKWSREFFPPMWWHVQNRISVSSTMPFYWTEKQTKQRCSLLNWSLWLIGCYCQWPEKRKWQLLVVRQTKHRLGGKEHNSS